MRFTKMHGLGNDYIFLNCMEGMPEDPGRLAAVWSDRHFGIGSDGLICLCPGVRHPFRMRMFNADGSEGEMCGNGIRCLGKFIRDLDLSREVDLTVETAAGPRKLTLLDWNPKKAAVRVDMGRPEVGEPVELEAGGGRVRLIPVSMGNPHGVCLLEPGERAEPERLGPLLERHPAFPGGINVEFAEVLAEDRLRVRVWERGSGATLACGTGACAAAAAAQRAGRVGRSVTVELPGGTLELCRTAEDALLMTGPAVTVYQGEIAPS